MGWLLNEWRVGLVLACCVLVAGGCSSRTDVGESATGGGDAPAAEIVDVADESGMDLVDMAELHNELAKPLTGTEARGDQPIAVWKPDVDQLLALGAPQSMEGYEISLPVNFRAVENPNRERFAEMGISVFQWMGPAAAGEPGPTLSITIHPAVSTPRDCEEALEGYLENMQREWPRTEVEKVEHGNIGDMPGVRAKYETFPAEDLRIVGRTYFVQDGLRALMIDVKGVGELGDEVMRLLDTAALTFRSKMAEPVSR